MVRSATADALDRSRGGLSSIAYSSAGSLADMDRSGGPVSPISRSVCASADARPLSRGAARFLARRVLGAEREADVAARADALATAGVLECHVGAGRAVFELGASPEAFYCVLTGEALLGGVSADLETGAFTADDGVRAVASEGAFVGYGDHVLARPRTFACVGGAEGVGLAVFEARGLDALSSGAAEILVLLQKALLRTAATELAQQV